MNLSKKEQDIYDKKIAKVMGEFKDGTLISGGSGKKVKDRKTAIAIAISEGLAALEEYRKKKK